MGRDRWQGNLSEELDFWYRYHTNEHIRRADQYGNRLDPDEPLQEHIAQLLPRRDEVDILDVGAGPLTCVGKYLEGVKVNITATDPLADDYDILLVSLGITPLVHTQKCDGERLTEMFPPDSFDVVYARNSLDHSYDPVEAIAQMYAVTRPGGYVMLEHWINEGRKNGYSGLHQWDFCIENGDFCINSRSGKANISKLYPSLTWEPVNEGYGDWIVVTILKISS